MFFFQFTLPSGERGETKGRERKKAEKSREELHQHNGTTFHAFQVLNDWQGNKSPRERRGGEGVD